MIENCRTVLCSPVRPLAVQLRGIVILPKHLEQILIGNLGRVVLNLDRFGVSGAIGANIFVGGVWEMAASVANAGRNHAGNLPERSFDSPKAARRESGFGHNFPPNSPCPRLFDASRPEKEPSLELALLPLRQR